MGAAAAFDLLLLVSWRLSAQNAAVSAEPKQSILVIDFNIKINASYIKLKKTTRNVNSTPSASKP